MSGTSKDSEKEPKSTSSSGFSEQERAAMKVRASELKSKARGGRGAKKAAADEEAVLANIAEMELPDRAIAERIHVIVADVAPELMPKLWYGQPAYARKGGKAVCFFCSGQVDKERYSTFGFSVEANLDDGGMWPTSYAVTELTDSAETEIARLVLKAVS